MMDGMQSGSNSKGKDLEQRVMQQESKRCKSEKTPTNICTGSFQKV